MIDLPGSKHPRRVAAVTRRLVLAACMLLGTCPIAAGVETLLLPQESLWLLARPGGGPRAEIARGIQDANPWAASVRVRQDLHTFVVEIEPTSGEPIRLTGESRDAYALLLGQREQLSTLLQVPDTYTISGFQTTADGLRIALLARAPKQEVGSDSVERETPDPGFWKTLGERSSITLRGLASHQANTLTLGSLNPDNQLLDLPARTSAAEVRLDASLDLDRLFLWGKPRFLWQQQRWSDGPSRGESEAESEVTWQEGAAQVRLHDSLIASFGRETLLWGSGQLTNPSNPFFLENGRENAVREIPGTDFFRLVYLPNYSWTLSWLSNTGRGEADLNGADWHSAHAVKVEYVGYTGNGGVLAHFGTGHRTSVSGYGQWTASDAVLLYGELKLGFGTRALYPTRAATPLGLDLEESRDQSSELVPVVLLGGSYTLESGPTLYVEYLYNNQGYDDTDAERFYDLVHGLARLVAQGALPAAAAGSAAYPPFLRRNYLMLQYLETEIADRMTVNARWTQNLDDGSGLATLFLEWNLSDRWRLFSFGGYGSGGNRDEYGSIVRWSGTAGLEFSAF